MLNRIIHFHTNDKKQLFYIEINEELTDILSMLRVNPSCTYNERTDVDASLNTIAYHHVYKFPFYNSDGITPEFKAVFNKVTELQSVCIQCSEPLNIPKIAKEDETVGEWHQHNSNDNDDQQIFNQLLYMKFDYDDIIGVMSQTKNYTSQSIYEKLLQIQKIPNYYFIHKSDATETKLLAEFPHTNSYIENKEEMLGQLISMDFNPEIVLEAVEKFSNFEQALQFCLNKQNMDDDDSDIEIPKLEFGNFLPVKSDYDKSDFDSFLPEKSNLDKSDLDSFVPEKKINIPLPDFKPALEYDWKARVIELEQQVAKFTDLEQRVAQLEKLMYKNNL